MTTRAGKVVLFGGYTGGTWVNSDLWEWDGTNWTPAPLARPGRSSVAFPRSLRRRDRWSCTAAPTSTSCR